eukprot:5541188-Lingulodinium_polyedra.AAC.1
MLRLEQTSSHQHVAPVFAISQGTSLTEYVTVSAKLLVYRCNDVSLRCTRPRQFAPPRNVAHAWCQRA